MPKWNDILRNLFGGKPGPPDNQPLLHEMIERSETEQAAFLRWVGSPRYRNALEAVYEAFHLGRNGENLLGDVFYHIDNPSTKGFMLHYREEWFTPGEFTHYFDHLKERVHSLGYKLYTSDVRGYARKEHAETIERHYLKPAWRLTDGQKQEQRFGNITITLHRNNDHPTFIKLLCHPYADRQFTEAEDFEEVLGTVLVTG